MPANIAEKVQITRAKGIRELQRLAAEYHQKNAESNRLKTEAGHARQKLYKLMCQGGVTEFVFKVGRVPMEAVIEKPVKNKVSLKKLKSLTGSNTYEQCLSATQKDVELYAGKEILRQVLDEEPCDENVYVKPATSIKTEVA